MEIKLNIEKKHLYFGAILLTLFAGIILVKSYDPSQGWHSADQIASGVMAGPISVSESGGRVTMGDDGNNPYLEIRAVDGSGQPYLDFNNDASSDYNARFILTGNDNLKLDGANLEISSGSATISGSVIMGYEVLTSTGELSSVTATCSSGKKVIGGGCEFTPGLTNYILISRPLTDGTGWKCSQEYFMNIRVYAICARIN